MLAICPNCRHIYQNELYSACLSCYSQEVCCVKPCKINLSSNCNAGTKCNVNFNTVNESSLLKQKQRIRKLLSGGTVVGNNEGDKNREKSNNLKNSPSGSLSFILPTVSLFSSCNALSRIDEKYSFLNSEEDFQRLATAQKLLKLSGWYHQKLTWKSAMNLLMPTPVGTFLIRDSSDSNYLYSLSIQTKCGPSSIRIHYSKGEFRLDADHNMAKFMPKFPCLMKLIQSYTELTKHLPLICKQEDEKQKLINCIGILISQIVIIKPLHTKDYFPSLKHLSRLCINRNLVDSKFMSVLPAPAFVINYLQEYPYKF
ncbi:hypothetical protein PGB90_010571 [Kerria lacca]